MLLDGDFFPDLSLILILGKSSFPFLTLVLLLLFSEEEESETKVLSIILLVWPAFSLSWIYSIKLRYTSRRLRFCLSFIFLFFLIFDCLNMSTIEIGDVVDWFVVATFCFLAYNFMVGVCVLFWKVDEGPTVFIWIPSNSSCFDGLFAVASVALCALT